MYLIVFNRLYLCKYSKHFEALELISSSAKLSAIGLSTSKTICFSVQLR